MKAPSDGGGRNAAPAARGARFGVWAPILLKLLGIVFGMLALAAIGASSIARGSGVPNTIASSRARTAVAQAGSLPLAGGSDAGTGASDAGSDGGGEGSTAGMTADGKVILNLAGNAELCRLPGVGPKRADAILALRARLGGRFKRLSDLLRVKGIGVRSLKKMQPYLVLDAPQLPGQEAADGGAKSSAPVAPAP